MKQSIIFTLFMTILGATALTPVQAEDLIYVAAEPCRIVDTRNAGGAIPANNFRNFRISGTVGELAVQGGNSDCLDPKSGTGQEPLAIVAYVLAVPAGGSGSGVLTAYPSNQLPPPVGSGSTVNFSAGQIIGNTTTITLCDPSGSCPTDGEFAILARNTNQHVIVDVQGYFYPQAGGSVTVDCSNGDSVGSALASGKSNITVLGTCNEFVYISRDDVTLTAHANGGSIISPTDESAIIIDGARVDIIGLTIGGLGDGIEIDGGASVVVESVTIDSVGGDGIEVFSNSSVFVEGSTITNNSGFGIQVDASSYGEIIGTTISGNARMGIIISGGSSAEIGYAGDGNTITNNAEGIHIQLGSTATLSSNTISGQLTGFGIVVHSNSMLNLAGGNSITSNGNFGIYAQGATVNQFSNASTESITQNVGGIVLYDSRLSLLDATVKGGSGNGISAFGNTSISIGESAFVTDGVFCGSSRPYINTTVAVNVDTVTNCSDP